MGHRPVDEGRGWPTQRGVRCVGNCKGLAQLLRSWLYQSSTSRLQPKKFGWATSLHHVTKRTLENFHLLCWGCRGIEPRLHGEPAIPLLKCCGRCPTQARFWLEWGVSTPGQSLRGARSRLRRAASFSHAARDRIECFQSRCPVTTLTDIPPIL